MLVTSVSLGAKPRGNRNIVASGSNQSAPALHNRIYRHSPSQSGTSRLQLWEEKDSLGIRERVNSITLTTALPEEASPSSL